MHSINILEQKLVKYKTKKYGIYAFILICFLGLFFVSKFYLNKIRKDNQISSNEKKLKLVINANLNILEPNLTIIKTRQSAQKNLLTSNVKQQGEQIVTQIENLSSKDSSFSNVQNSNNKIVQQNSETYEQPERIKKKVKLTQESNVATLIDIMKRFNESHDPNDSLFLAISYYEKKEYNKALFWAIETNKITEEIEDSWIIMAKSKFYLGDKNEATRILKAYASKTGSKEALNIINEFENENK
ncbi:MAG: CDC27 family protein [Sulfurovaceae bacterium]|nr:CDC27 family protein [Sulfurovaceae bacterium]